MSIFKSGIKEEAVKMIGTALVGGDFMGNARGADAIDVQTNRSVVTQVASGARSIAIGYQNTVSAYDSIAIGKGCTASAAYGSAIAIGINCTAAGAYNKNVAIGYACVASGYSRVAIGSACQATGDFASALGYKTTASGYESTAVGQGAEALGSGSSAFGNESEARIDKTTNICGPQINRKDNGESAGSAFVSFCGVQVVLMTKEVDLKAVADQTITLPAGCKFWFDEMGLIATSIDTLTVQPTIRFGITGTPAKQSVAAQTTAITAAGKREIETPLVPEDGETSLVAGVTVAATATTAKGRFWFRGLLIEDE